MKKLFVSILCGMFIITVTVIAQPYEHPMLPPDPESIIEAVEITEGMIIGEAGAGTGYVTFPLAEAVGESGRIYANDIDPEVLETIRDRCEQDKVKNITTVLGDVDDPLFPVRNLDMIIMRYVFHDLTEPVAWMNNVKPYLKPDAMVVIIDLARNKATNYDRNHPYLSEDELVTIMERTDFELVGIDRNIVVDNIYFYRLPE